MGWKVEISVRAFAGLGPRENKLRILYDTSKFSKLICIFSSFLRQSTGVRFLAGIFSHLFGFQEMIAYPRLTEEHKLN